MGGKWEKSGTKMGQKWDKIGMKSTFPCATLVSSPRKEGSPGFPLSSRLRRATFPKGEGFGWAFYISPYQDLPPGGKVPPGAAEEGDTAEEGDNTDEERERLMRAAILLTNSKKGSTMYYERR